MSDESDKLTTDLDENAPLKLYKFSVSNSFVTATGAIRAVDLAEAAAGIELWLTAGLTIKEQPEA